MKLLITGMAGFIGHAVAKLLAGKGCDIVGIDNLNEYYDVNLKRARLEDLAPYQNVKFVELDLTDWEGVTTLFAHERFTHVIHLAAQAGVRYSLENPHAYINSNVTGHLNVLEHCYRNDIEHLVYASSSSVYGTNKKVPFNTEDDVSSPISLYAATKKTNELMASTYSHLHNLPATGLRFFTVYGPWGRPDMAPFKFTKALLSGEPIPVFNHGNMYRDFTYIDDIVNGVARILKIIPQPGSKQESKGDVQPPHSLYNIGRGNPTALMDFIRAIEDATGCSARFDFLPMQPGDVPRTWADTEAFFSATGYQPKIGIEEGVNRFVKWYQRFYNI